MSDPKGESSGMILQQSQLLFGLILSSEIMAFLKLSVCVVGEGIAAYKQASPSFSQSIIIFAGITVINPSSSRHRR
jgi:hypothetical protein